MILFSIQLGWMPVSGRGGLLHVILPALTLGLGMAAILTRILRASLIQVARAEFVQTARAKGLSEKQVWLKHMLRNALLSVVTIMSLQFGALLAGSLITETVFSWPGIGRLTVQAIQTRDYPLVQGCVLVIAVAYVLVNFFTDIALQTNRPAGELWRVRLGSAPARQSCFCCWPRRVGAPIIAPHNPLRQDLANDLIAYSADHLLGTDKLGRDILSRTIYGARISLSVGFATVALSLAIGLIVGSLAGYFGGWIDLLLMRLVDILLAFPGILLAIAFTAVLGPGLDHVILALCLIGWTGYARLVRGEIIALREREFIQAARALGGAPSRVDPAPSVAESLGAAVDPSDFRPRRRDHRRRQLEFPRPGRRTANAVLGIDVERRPAVPARRAASHHLSRAGDHGHSVRAQSGRRRAAGSVRKAIVQSRSNRSIAALRSNRFQEVFRFEQSWNGLNVLNDLNEFI